MKMQKTEDSILEKELFETYSRTKDEKVRNTIVDRYIYIARIIAKQFCGRGIDYDDLYQVACIGLLYAVERFDVNKGIKFASFATPTISGEIKHYFRDKGNFIRVPRKLYEMFLRADKIHEANKADSDENEELVMPRMVSLEQEVLGDDIRFSHILGKSEDGFLVVENRDFADRCLRSLSEDERKFVHKRYFEEKSQKQIAQDMGVSQMCISRMERKVLKRLRDMYFKEENDMM